MSRVAFLGERTKHHYCQMIFLIILGNREHKPFIVLKCERLMPLGILLITDVWYQPRQIIVVELWRL